jgi:hypothetical protein
MEQALVVRDYGSVVSIGSQCLTSALLQRAALKRFSGPFDWIFSNLRMVCDCIEDDFATLLDPAHIIAIPPETRTQPDAQYAQHRFYQARYGLHSIFNHSDPTRPEVYAYLQRCVARFRDVLAADRPQLLLAVSPRAQGGRYAFDRLCGLLESRPNVEVCAFILSEPGERRAIDLWAENGRHRLFHLHLTSGISGIQFAEWDDEAFVLDTLRGMIALTDPAPGA